MTRKLRHSAALVLAGLVTWSAAAGGLDKFTLTKAIPADAVMAVHTRGHEGQAFLDKQMDRMWAEVEKARFDRDFKRLFKSLAMQDGTTAEDFEAHWQKLVDLTSAVDWRHLTTVEYGMGMKLGFPMPEYVVMMKPTADSLSSSFDGLTEIIKALVGLNPGMLQLTSDGDGETITHRVSVSGAPFPLGLTLARRGDVIVIGFGTTLVEQSLALLGGESGQTLASTERFQKAFADLPAAADSAIYVDIAKLFSQIRGIIDQAMQMAPAPAEGDPGYEQEMAARQIPGKLLNRVDIFDYAATVATTDGMTTTTDSVLVLKDGAKSTGLYKMMFGNGTISEPFKYVPVDAENVSVGAGVDLLALYDEIIDVLKKDIPKGEQAVAEIAGLKEQIGYDLREDIIGWIRGNYVSFSLPGPTAYQPGEFAFLIGVRDEDKANQMVGAVMNMVAQNGGEQVAVEDAVIEGTEGFRSIKSPLLGMVGMRAPTVGIKDGFLWFGSSPEIVDRALAVASGKEENFSKNERFQKEGLPLGENMVDISFKNMTKWGQQIGQALNMVGMLPMFVPEIAKNPPAQAVLGILSKVGRVARKVDFLLSSAAATTFDGQVLKTRGVINYREPPKPKKPTPPSEGNSETNGG